MNECVNLENVGRVEELLAMTEQMQDELDQKDQTILELNRQLNRSLTLNEKLNSENRAENIEALRTKLKQTEEQLTSETDSRKRADAEVVAWKFKYEKAEQAKRYAQTHQKTVEVPVEKKVPYEKCDNCDRTAYQKAKEKCDNRKIQLEKKYKQMTTGYESDIAISVVIENDNLVISVSDDGCGFKNIDIEKATLPFYKSSKDIATEHLGLGLNISKILSERHGGNIQIANNKAGGACVTVKINCNES